MATERSFQKSYLAALKAVVKKKRHASGGLKLSPGERLSAKYEAKDVAEEHERSESGAVVSSLVPKSKYGYVVATDSAMSGWGGAPRSSIYAIAVNNDLERKIVTQNMTSRSEMKRVRFSQSLPRVTRGQHLSVKDQKQARHFYQLPMRLSSGKEHGFIPEKQQIKHVEFANLGVPFKDGYIAAMDNLPLSSGPYQNPRDVEGWTDGWHYYKDLVKKSK